MITPSPFPNEFAPGLIGRLGIIRGFKNSDQVLASLPLFPSNQDKNSPLVARVANTFSMDAAAFVQQHTLIPIHRAIVASGFNSQHGDISFPTILRRSLTQKLHQAYLCPTCVSEDIDFWGISYWRRTHHIPGFPWCYQHLTPLYSCQHPRAFDFFPDQLIEHAAGSGLKCNA